MKHLVKSLAVLILAFGLAGLANAVTTVYEEDFEKYAAGTEMVGTVEGWAFFNNYNGTSTVVDQGGLKALKLARKDGGSADYDMIITPAIDCVPKNPGAEYVKFSFKFKPSSGTDLFALYTTKKNDEEKIVTADRFFYFHANANENKLETNPTSVTFTNLDPSTWNEVEFLLDTVASKIVKITCNGKEEAMSLLLDSYKSTCPIIMRLSTQYSSQYTYDTTYYDYVKVETVYRSDSPVLITPDAATIPIGKTESVLSIYNGCETGEIEFTAETATEWLTISPESGKFTASQDITLKAAGSLAKGYYTGSVTIKAGEAGEATIPVVYQNGFIYAQNFDSLKTGESIFNQDQNYTQAYGSAGDGSTAIVKAGGAEGSDNYLEYYAADLFATHVNLKNTENLSAKYNLKFTFWLKCMDWGSDLWFGNSAQSLGEFEVHTNDSGTYIKTPAGIEVQNSGDLSDWTKVTYTVNTMAGNLRLLECTFGDGEALDLNSLISDSNEDAYPTFRTFIWGGSAKYGLDSLSIECIERGGTQPELEAVGGGIVNLGTNKVSMAVYNVGQGDLEFESAVVAGNDWLSIKGAGEGGVYTGKIEGTGSQNMTLLVDQSKIGNAYVHGTVRTTSGNMVKDVQVYSQGGNADGYTFYATDFESTELGGITEVDPAWLNANGTVIDDEGNRCLKITNGGQTHFKALVPDKLYDQYNIRFSCKMKFPDEKGDYSGNCFGTDMDHGQGEYNIDINEDGSIGLSSGNAGLDDSNITNVCQRCKWFDVSYTYNSDPLNRQLYSLTFGDSTYAFEEQYIDPAGTPDYGWFKEIRIYTWDTKDPYYIDDICVEAVPKSNDPPKMSVSVSGQPVAYSKDEATITVKNSGGRYFDFTSEVIEGAEYLSAATNATVYGTFQFKAKVDRSKLGYGFYRPKVRFTSTTAGVDPVEISLAIQSGSEKEGYVIYASDFNSLALTSEAGGGVINELSEQDACWSRNSSHNRVDVASDPAGSGKRVAKVVNANDWTSYPGYTLQLNVQSDVWDKFDAVYSMDIFIPEDFVDRSGEEHPDALFFVSQDNDHRQCEFKFSLDTEDSEKPVKLEPQDIANTEWWNENKDSMAKVANGTWFPFYFRFNCKLLDYDHKTLCALNFGENEFQMTDNDSVLSYPGGIDESVLLNEAMPKMKLWCYCDNAGICLDNVKIMLVPKGLPEPAIMGLAALLLALLSRKRG